MKMKETDCMDEKILALTDVMVEYIKPIKWIEVEDEYTIIIYHHAKKDMYTKKVSNDRELVLSLFDIIVDIIGYPKTYTKLLCNFTNISRMANKYYTIAYPDTYKSKLLDIDKELSKRFYSGMIDYYYQNINVIANILKKADKLHTITKDDYDTVTSLMIKEGELNKDELRKLKLALPEATLVARNMQNFGGREKYVGLSYRSITIELMKA